MKHLRKFESTSNQLDIDDFRHIMQNILDEYEVDVEFTKFPTKNGHSLNCVIQLESGLTIEEFRSDFSWPTNGDNTNFKDIKSRLQIQCDSEITILEGAIEHSQKVIKNLQFLKRLTDDIDQEALPRMEEYTNFRRMDVNYNFHSYTLYISALI